jgi:hypothetical protein
MSAGDGAEFCFHSATGISLHAMSVLLRADRRASESVLAVSRVLPGERLARLAYRSIRGSPKCGKTLLSANHVMAEILSRSSVRTNNAYGRATSVCREGR